jgi:hypothetical protein
MSDVNHPIGRDQNQFETILGDDDQQIVEDDAADNEPSPAI